MCQISYDEDLHLVALETVEYECSVTSALFPYLYAGSIASDERLKLMIKLTVKEICYIYSIR